MKRLFRIVFLLCSLLHALDGRGQEELPHMMTPGVPRFSIDALCFQAMEKESTYVEVCYKIVNDELQFAKTQNGYKASFEVQILVNDSAGNQVAGGSWRDEIKVKTFDETNSRLAFRVNFVPFILGPGTYHLKVKIIDLDSKLSGEVKKVLYVPFYGAKDFSMSTIELANSIVRQKTSSRFVKSGYMVVPNVSRTFNALLNPSLYIYYEIYNFFSDSLGDKGIFDVEYCIFNKDGNVVHIESKTFPKLGENVAQYSKFDVSSYESGAYRLRVRVKDEQTGENIEEYSDFSVTRPYWSIIGQDFYQVVKQLSYIASKSEIDKLKKEKFENRAKALVEFWKKRDPTPGTPCNETMLEYYRRLRYANEHFSTKIQQGWLTDRGRIYITYGPPDQVERHPYERNSKPYQVWYYYTNNYEFVFVDQTGFGYFILVYPPYWLENR